MEPLSALTRPKLLIAALVGVCLLAGCVYRVDVQQGNLLEYSDIQAVKPGMTRSQVRFLLGTPVVDDPFDKDRWDYIYYFRKGRGKRADQRWLIVLFSDDRVTEIRRDVQVEPS
ncbi:MAG: outer membrane protein assembly factor BamE [Chromatiales bacterium]|nr:MAG: outer membrane protein assembly factor BamE [Chromatiales bacterium]